MDKSQVGWKQSGIWYQIIGLTTKAEERRRSIKTRRKGPKEINCVLPTFKVLDYSLKRPTSSLHLVICAQCVCGWLRLYPKRLGQVWSGSLRATVKCNNSSGAECAGLSWKNMNENERGEEFVVKLREWEEACGEVKLVDVKWRRLCSPLHNSTHLLSSCDEVPSSSSWKLFCHLKMFRFCFAHTEREGEKLSSAIWNSNLIHEKYFSLFCIFPSICLHINNLFRLLSLLAEPTRCSPCAFQFSPLAPCILLWRSEQIWEEGKVRKWIVEIW